MTMQYVTAAEAGRRIGVSEKTVRLWIEKGQISAHHRKANRLAIPLPEVEALARERKQYEESGSSQSLADLAGQVALLKEEIEARPGRLDLESRFEAIEARIGKIESVLFRDQAALAVPALPEAYNLPALSAGVASASHQPRSRRKAEGPPLPAGCVLARDFALAHGVNPNTFRDHYIKGIGRGTAKELVHTEHRPKPGRESTSEQEYYLTPEQQELARDFWSRHGVIWHNREPGLDQDFTEASEENGASE